MMITKKRESRTKKVNRIKQHVRNDLQKHLEETWKNKVIHGKFPESLEKADFDRDQNKKSGSRALGSSPKLKD